jgi:hypothetical protein
MSVCTEVVDDNIPRPRERVRHGGGVAVPLELSPNCGTMPVGSALFRGEGTPSVLLYDISLTSIIVRSEPT